MQELPPICDNCSKVIECHSDCDLLIKYNSEQTKIIIELEKKTKLEDIQYDFICPHENVKIYHTTDKLYGGKILVKACKACWINYIKNR